MKTREQTRDEPTRADRLRRMVEEVLPVAKERAQLVGDIRAALVEGDDTRALSLARRLCGLPPSERTS